MPADEDVYNPSSGSLRIGQRKVGGSILAKLHFATTFRGSNERLDFQYCQASGIWQIGVGSENRALLMQILRSNWKSRRRQAKAAAAISCRLVLEVEFLVAGKNPIVWRSPGVVGR